MSREQHRTQYRIRWKREGLPPKSRKYWLKPALDRFVALLGPEPWKGVERYADQDPDDFLCCPGTAYHECGCGGVTVRQHFEEQLAEMPEIEWVKIEQRQVLEMEWRDVT